MKNFKKKHEITKRPGARDLFIVWMNCGIHTIPTATYVLYEPYISQQFDWKCVTSMTTYSLLNLRWILQVNIHDKVSVYFGYNKNYLRFFSANSWMS